MTITMLHHLPDFQSLIEPFGDGGTGEFNDGSNMNNLAVISGRRFLRRATETTPEEDINCFEPSSETGGITVVDDERCKRMLLIQPILIGFFALFLIICCWKKSKDDISDAYWCCCRKRRIKRQREQQIEVTTTTTTTDSIRSYNNTRQEAEQRELQQRQLPIMASIRRRERQLHQLRLEANARLEKRKRRIDQETQVRRVLLLSKFKEAGLEKVSVCVCMRAFLFR